MSELTLSSSEREVAAEEAGAVLAASREREDVARLVHALDGGGVPDDLQPLLEQIVDLGLQTGRIRAVYGPGGEQAALKLHRRLPGGREAAASAREVTEALAALRGRELDSITVTAAGPGAFTLQVQAGGAELSLRLDRGGARLASVAV